MPLPEPQDGEKRQEFVDRCMADGRAKEDFPEERQRAAVCFNQYRKARGRKLSVNQMLQEVDKMLAAKEGNRAQDGAVPQEAGQHLTTLSLSTNVNGRVEKFEGKNHHVFPVVALVEGVHAGSRGPTFYPSEEIGKYVGAWNGIPVPIQHPTDEAGNFISVNASPKVVENTSVGRFWNVEYREGKLRGEIWIDPERAQKKAPGLMSTIRSNGRLEVSTGLFADGDGMPGTWNGEHFQETVRHFRPDHLALLPGGKGACSWEDGCGVRANQDGEPTEEIPPEEGETINNDTKGAKRMADDKKPCCPEKVSELIGNEHSRFEDADRDWLETLTEDQLEKLAPVVVEVEKPVANEEDPIAALSDEDRTTLEWAKREIKKRKETLIGKITANKRNEFTAEELQAKELHELEKYAKAFATPDYSGAAGGPEPTANTDKVPGMLPPSGLYAKEK